MRIGTLSFEPGWVATLAAAGLIALTVWLGNWQVDRAGQKRARQALFEARAGDAPLVLTGAVAAAEPLMYRRVRARGAWVAARQAYVDNRIRAGRAGFEVITPLRLDSGDAVLVNRGWIARGPEYPRAPQVAVPPGLVEVSGMATRPPERFLELAADNAPGDVVQNLSIERYARRTGLALLPVVVLADVPAAGLAPVREQPDAGIARHQEYALTWYSLAATTLALWLGLNVKRARP